MHVEESGMQLALRSMYQRAGQVDARHHNQCLCDCVLVLGQQGIAPSGGAACLRSRSGRAGAVPGGGQQRTDL